MTISTKKLKNGFEMPVFGLGTWMMGGNNDPDPNSDNQKDVELIKSAIKLGITHIDTAEVYAAGVAEQIVRDAIKDTDRSRLFITSKVQQAHLNYADIKTALHNSLKRLGVEYLDLYLLHRCPPLGKFKKCVRALNELVEEGLVKNIGLCNTNLEHTKQLCEISKYPIAATQVHYSLRFREPEYTGLLEFCKKNDIMLAAWRPLGMGVLKRGRCELENIPLIRELSLKYSKTPVQIALNWLICQPNVVTLTKTSNPLHLKENLGALNWQMERADWEKIDKDFPDQEKISDTIPLA